MIKLQFPIKFATKKAPKPLREEVAPVSKSLTMLGYFVGKIIWNPDRVLSSTHAEGKGLALYQEMLDKDPQIASGIRTRKKAVTNKKWEIVPASESSRDIEIAEFTAHAYNYKRRRESWFELLDCIPKGFSVSEIMWWYDPQLSKLVPFDLRGRDPGRFVFDKEFNLRLISMEHPIEGEELPERKFIYLRNEPFAENPYGHATLMECWWYYYFKKLAMEFWVRYAEKYATPSMVAQYPRGELNPEQHQALETILETHRNATYFKIPDGIDLKLLESVRRGDVSYADLINYCDEQIAKTIHGQTLTSGQGKGGQGSYALGQVHAETKQEYTADDCELLCDGLNRQLTKPVVDLNYANVTDYPRLVIHYEPPEDLVQEAKRDETLVKMGLPISPKYFYGKYNVPEPEEGEETVTPPPKIGGFSTFTQKKFARTKGYTIATTIKIEDKFYRLIQEILMGMEEEYLALLAGDQPLRMAVEELVRNKFLPQMEGAIDKLTRESIIHGAQSMADQLRIRISSDRFTELINDYFVKRAYERGTIPEMTNTIRDLLTNKAQALFDRKLSVLDIQRQLRKAFPEMAEWKAKQIAVTEVSKAGHYAGIEMIKQSGLAVDAWFVTNPDACDMCQEIAVRNPYTLMEADYIGLLHPNCRCMWSYTVKGKTIK